MGSDRFTWKLGFHLHLLRNIFPAHIVSQIIAFCKENFALNRAEPLYLFQQTAKTFACGLKRTGKITIKAEVVGEAQGKKPMQLSGMPPKGLGIRKEK